MNEPSSKVDGSPNGCPENNELEHPPYVPSKRFFHLVLIIGNNEFAFVELVTANLYDQTLCMSSRQINPGTGAMTDHYNMHSLYGKSHALPTLYACR